MAVKEERVDLVGLLAGFRADVDAWDSVPTVEYLLKETRHTLQKELEIPLPNQMELNSYVTRMFLWAHSSMILFYLFDLHDPARRS